MECKYKETSRIGLYILVLLVLLHTCSIDAVVKRIEGKLDRIESIVEKR